ncbi:2-dehydro-3-deoxygluconokinase [Microbacteriaceae bacterium SG_E_30_P1]|uniref:2-dehydro-3-deoxygluconokinase n=1 Tax=Antiquaquibacter oligotrophicus TaxID=2880260 RepID=A0ABT6KKF0_9MICO|nr:sugar kinase [Antiquaquibacter oligotrophicus]MDH6180175.1 2-dehydro-3-deoxygluconokinase [Antiquaquibacter oligotrophicus]UDF14073.1 sugar kinase [Antiquaquibacter oligotrophicus]
MSGVVTLGETMGLLVAENPGPRPTGFRLGMGGAESNLAIGLARLGVESTWIGRLGSDSTGDLIARELRAEGVTSRITVDPDAPTGLMMKSWPVAGRTRVEYHRRGSAGSRLEPDDIDEEVVGRASVVHVTGITPALSETAGAAVDRAIEIASGAGIPVSLDINHRASLWRDRDAGAVYRSLAARSTILFAGDDEARLLVDGDSPEQLAVALSGLGPTRVLVKLGAEGCVALIDGDLFRVPAVPITPADTVGAGDAFAAGYLAEYVSGLSSEQALGTAVLAGAFACLGAGDWESLPHRQDLGFLDGSDPVQR